jgi:hypothetical protein
MISFAPDGSPILIQSQHSSDPTCHDVIQTSKHHPNIIQSSNHHTTNGGRNPIVISIESPRHLDEEIVADPSRALGLVPGEDQVSLTEAACWMISSHF